MRVYTGTLQAVRGRTATLLVPDPGRTKPATLVVEVARCARVTCNGDRAFLDELRPGDDVEVTKAGGLAIDVRVVRR